MKLTRRDAMTLGLGATAASFLPLRAMSASDRAIEAFTGGAEPVSGGLTLVVPQVVENSDAVSITVDAPGAVSVILLATGNPTPLVARFDFGPLAGAQTATTRVYLGNSQNVTAVARLADGSFVQASSAVKIQRRPIWRAKGV